ncbi:ankyrin repeat-containing protein [Apiospora sp. TS-2023a]
MHLPPELAGRVFEFIACSRELKRVMRLRIVSRMFKHYIDDVIFRLKLLHRVPKSPSPEWLLVPRREPTHTEWCSLVFQYLAYHAWIETEPNSLLGRIRRAAVFVSEQCGDTYEPAVMVRLASLCRLAANNENGPGINWMLFWSDDPDEVRDHDNRWSAHCSEAELQDDLCVAAAYLGCRPHIETVISQRRLLCPWGHTSQVESKVFGRAYDAAVMSGNLPMMRLLLSSSPNYVPGGPLHRNVRRTTLELAAIFGHMDAYEFALGSEPDSMRKSIENIVQELRFPHQYKQALSILRNDSSERIELLSRKARYGHTDMVRYLLSQGVSPNHEHGKEEGPFCRPYKPLIQAVEKGDLDLVHLLLEHGADPNWFHPTNTPLMVAARLNRLTIAVTLIVAGADVDVGCPPPIVLAVLKEDMDMFRLLRGRGGARLDTPETGGWAMALARLHGLDSMVEVLENEGVGRDVVLHRCGRFEELYSDLYLYEWPPEPLEFGFDGLGG